MDTEQTWQVIEQHRLDIADLLGWPFWARRRLHGLRLTATDVDWSVGSGAEVSGPIRGLLLLLTGRTSTAAPLLSGEGLAQLVGSTA
jgi:hypothetical protein